MWSVDRRKIGDCVSEVEELIGKRQELSEARVFVDWTGQKSDAKSSRMSPSDLSWLQGCLFLFLGLAGGYGLNRCQNRRTNHGTSDVELGSIVVDNGSTPPPSDDADSSGGDEEARSPWNLSNPAGKAMVFTGAPRCPDRNRLRSNSPGRSRRLFQPSAKTRKKSHFLEFVVKTAAPNLATAYSTIVADRTSSSMSSPTEGLLRLSGGEDEALPPSHPVREVLAAPGTPSCPDRSRYDSCRRMNAPEKRTKSPFANFMAQDEARNVGTPEPANVVAAMASKTAVLRRPPRRHFVPRPSLEIPLVDHVQARTSDGLRFRPRKPLQMELPEDSSAASASQLSRVKTTEMVDTGESSAAALQPAQWQQLMQAQHFLGIDEGVNQVGAGWRVIRGVVSAYLRILSLVRIRRMQRTPLRLKAVRRGPGPRYKGIRQRNGKWVTECRIRGTPEQVWLGSFNTEKEAALALDAGKYHCSAGKLRNYNFADSPRLLGAPENLMHLSSVERRTRIRRLAEDHARTYGNAHIH